MNLDQHLALAHAEAGAADAHAGACAPQRDDYWYRVGFFIAQGTDPQDALVKATGFPPQQQ